MTVDEFVSLNLDTEVFVVTPTELGTDIFSGVRRGLVGRTVGKGGVYPHGILRYRIDSGKMVIEGTAKNVYTNAETALSAALQAVDQYVDREMQTAREESARIAVSREPQIRQNAETMRSRCFEIRDLSNVLVRTIAPTDPQKS